VYRFKIMDSVNVQIYKIDIGILIFVKKKIDFDRNIKKIILKHIGLTVLKDFFVDIYLVYSSLNYSFLHKFFFF
jgi:hypothetical protein